MNHVMVDLETMGNSSNCAIISIGAVFFDPATRQLGPEFYEIVDLESSVRVGMKIDPSTVMWWMQQSEDARKQFNVGGRLDIVQALTKFSRWFEQNKGVYVWGNGAAFDNVILGNAYRALDAEQPWKHWNDRCYRTMKGMYRNIEMNRIGTYHSAIDDAKSQALHLLDIMTYISGGIDDGK